MNTKDIIKEKSRELFNEQGLPAVTLRDVAAALQKSYGNITYHFAGKEQVVKALYADMINELQAISQHFKQEADLLAKILAAPNDTFHISLKYLFLFKDYVYILRTYPNIATMIKQSNEMRKAGLKQVLLHLQQIGMLRADLTEKDIMYIMELSGAMRTFFFLQLTENEIDKPNLQKEYVEYINQLLYPYLSEKGNILKQKYEDKQNKNPIFS